MRALLDTHTFLWWIADDARLSGTAREVIASPDNEIIISAASAWEIAIKARNRRLTLPADADAFISDQVASNAFEVLPVTMRHALRVYSLPDHHRDPFDRLLVAQAQIENVPLLTADTELARYAIHIVW
ncbi:MAG: type II toxin-antitoxin system VapC family toxin [Candidatus Binataceae bacterium]